jgi:ubiquinone/menaquinone biosynthesis C-methylase UbiE
MAANAEALPFADGSFDRYLANFTLYLTKRPASMVREARRVLKPGGIAGSAAARLRSWPSLPSGALGSPKCKRP